jgi:hypothetical protein
MSKAVIMQNGTLISASVRATEGDFGVSADSVLDAESASALAVSGLNLFPSLLQRSPRSPAKAAVSTT